MRFVNLTKTDEGDYEITSPVCPNCGLDGITETISSTALYSLNLGATMLEALPYLPDNERERFISGYCSECWDILFSFDDE